MHTNTIARLALAIVVGVALRYVVSIEPSAAMAWVAPFALLLLAFSTDDRRWRMTTLLATLIAATADVRMFLRVMPPPMVVVVVIGQAMLWLAIVSETRRALFRWRTGWSVLLYPILWAAADTLMAALLPDGNWASLAYTQGDVLPLLQVTRLAGVAGVVFIVCLAPAALAAAATLGIRAPGVRAVLVLAATTTAGAFGYGVLELRSAPTAGPTMAFGLAAIDDAIGRSATPHYVVAIRDAYGAMVADLARRGAHLVLLPEKIAVTTPVDAEAWRAHWAALARDTNVWLLAGLAIDTPDGTVNEAWLFDPTGQRVQAYQKQFLAPPERDYRVGHVTATQPIDDVPFGIAICKDMHFATLGRRYGQAHVSAMLVPAWDFWLDRWKAARLTTVRGIENDYVIVRASRDGLMTVTDGHGRIIAEQESGPMPGRTMLATVAIPESTTTLYTRIGNLFGWTCVIAAVPLVVLARRPRSATGSTAA